MLHIEYPLRFGVVSVPIGTRRGASSPPPRVLHVDFSYSVPPAATVRCTVRCLHRSPTLNAWVCGRCRRRFMRVSSMDRAVQECETDNTGLRNPAFPGAGRGFDSLTLTTPLGVDELSRATMTHGISAELVVAAAKRNRRLTSSDR